MADTAYTLLTGNTSDCLRHSVHRCFCPTQQSTFRYIWNYTYWECRVQHIRCDQYYPIHDLIRRLGHGRSTCGTTPCANVPPFVTSPGHALLTTLLRCPSSNSVHNLTTSCHCPSHGDHPFLGGSPLFHFIHIFALLLQISPVNIPFLQRCFA